MPPSAVLVGLLPVISYSMSHCSIEIDGTDWVEPVILWISISMITGSGKSGLCKFLKGILENAHKIYAGKEDSSAASWLLDDQSFEKMGALLEENHGKLIGLYDEFALFLSQMNAFRGKGMTQSNEVSVFLQLYDASSWVRKTGKQLIESWSVHWHGTQGILAINSKVSHLYA